MDEITTHTINLTLPSLTNLTELEKEFDALELPPSVRMALLHSVVTEQTSSPVVHRPEAAEISVEFVCDPPEAVCDPPVCDPPVCDPPVMEPVEQEEQEEHVEQMEQEEQVEQMEQEEQVVPVLSAEPVKSLPIPEPPLQVETSSHKSVVCCCQ